MRISRREILGLGGFALLGSVGYRMRSLDGVVSLHPTSNPAATNAGLLSEVHPLGFPPVTAEAGYLRDSLGNFLYSLHGDKVLTDWGSVRKMLAGVVVLEEKRDVLDTELVAILQADINTTGPEFQSGLAHGEQVIWRDVLKLMLVPSMSDVAAAITRVLGEELRLKYGIGDSAQQAIGYWMSNVAVRAGAKNVITLTNTSTHIGTVQDEVLPQNMYASSHALAQCLEFVLSYPELLEIMQLQSVSVEVGGSNPRTITHGTVDRLRAAWDATGSSTGYEFYGYVAGKTGDTTTWGNQVFSCEMPSGDTVYGAVYKSFSRELRVQDIIRTIMAAENHHPHLRGAETAADPHAANVAFRILGDMADSGPLARTITNSSVTTEASDFGSAMVFNSAGLTVGGTAPGLGVDDFTLEVYLRGNGQAQASTVVLAGHWRAIALGRGWMLQLDGSEVQFLYSVDGNNPITVSFPLDRAYLMNGAPSTITVQRSGASLAVFVHGIRSAVHNIGSATIYNPSASPVTIGSRQGAGSATERHFAGLIEEVTLTLGVVRYGMAGYRPRYRPARWDSLTP